MSRHLTVDRSIELLPGRLRHYRQVARTRNMIPWREPTMGDAHDGAGSNFIPYEPLRS